MCWISRVDRAEEILADRDEESREKLLGPLRRDAIKALTDAALAVGEYVDLCKQVDRQPQDPYPSGLCDCAECQKKDRVFREKMASKLKVKA